MNPQATLILRETFDWLSNGIISFLNLPSILVENHIRSKFDLNGVILTPGAAPPFVLHIFESIFETDSNATSRL